MANNIEILLPEWKNVTINKLKIKQTYVIEILKKYQKVASSTVLTYAPPAITRPIVAPVNNLPYNL